MTRETDAQNELCTSLVDNRDGGAPASEIVDSLRLQSLFDALHTQRLGHAADAPDGVAISASAQADDSVALALAHPRSAGRPDIVLADDDAFLEEIIDGGRMPAEALEIARSSRGFAPHPHSSLEAWIEGLDAAEDQLD